MTELETKLHEDLGFIVSGVQVQFIVFIKDKPYTRAVMPTRQTDVLMWNLLTKKQEQLNQLRMELELTRQALDEAVTELGKRKEFPRV